jgi:amino acid adenylation domain-containing protein
MATVKGLSMMMQGTEHNVHPSGQRQSGGGSVFPASTVQRQFWLLHELVPDSPAYNITHAFRISGPLDGPALTDSLRAVVRRHAALHTTFATRGEQLVQIVHPGGQIDIPTMDVPGPSGMQQEAAVRCLVQAEAVRPFDLNHGPLMRSLLLRLADQNHVLITAMHHIITDLYAFTRLFHEVAALYVARTSGTSCPLDEPACSYPDYAVWEQQWRAQDDFSSMLSYWERRLRRQDSLLALPTDRPRPAVQSLRGDELPVELPGDLITTLSQWGRGAGAPLFVTLLSAYLVLLHRYTRQSSIIVGVPFTNRRRPPFQDVMGCCVNILPLCVDLSGEPGFRQVTRRVRQAMLEAHRCQEVTLESIVERLRLSRNLSYNPLYQAGFTFAPPADLPLPDLQVELLSIPTASSQLDLFMTLWESHSGVRGRIEYSTDLFDRATIERVAGHYQRLLATIATDADQSVTVMPILSRAEREQILVQWNDTWTDYPQDRCIHQWFETQACRTPDAAAVVFEDRKLTYRELDERANRLAHLLQSDGVGPDVPVGIAVERSVEMIVGLYGILKAGGAYMPLDPSYPAERLAYMAQEAGVRIVLTQARLLDKLPEFAGRVVCLDRDWDDQMAGQSVETPVCNATMENLAYIIYTSGSTGRPKGVMNTHRGILNRLLWMQDQYGLTASDRVLQKTPFSFDVSVWEFFWPLMFGARLVVARPEGHKDCEYLVRRILDEQITVVHFVPSMLQLFLETRDVEKCDCLRHVICSGETLSVDLQNRFFDRLGARLHNLYGPTEAAVDVTFWECRRDRTLKTVPIGRPVANTQIYILDSRMQPVSIGVPGELHIGGVQVARGYVNRPDLTAERFIPDPFSDDPAAHLYKTGDLARYLPDGNIEYMGRLDHQIKMRGLRIELAEIESVLIQHPAVREAVVVAREDTPGSQRLVAYVVPHLASPLDAKGLRDHLAQSLPDYMVPAAFVTLDALPLTSSGKVDRRSLPAPKEQTRSEGTYLAPRTSLEEAIAQIWRDLLCVEQVGVHDNFFDLGGHSLLLVQAHRRVRRITDKDLSVADLFRFSTIGSLAEHLSRDSNSERAQTQVAVQRSVHRAMARRAAILRRQQAT